MSTEVADIPTPFAEVPPPMGVQLNMYVDFTKNEVHFGTDNSDPEHVLYALVTALEVMIPQIAKFREQIGSKRVRREIVKALSKGL